jgi:hypothetical protein
VLILPNRNQQDEMGAMISVFHAGCVLASLLLIPLAKMRAAPASGEGWARASGDGISLEYPKQHASHAWFKVLPRKSQKDGWPENVGPRRWQVSLVKVLDQEHFDPHRRHSPRGPGKNYTPFGVIWVTPLFDRSVWGFRRNYPDLAENAGELKALFASRTKTAGPEEHYPSEPWINAGRMIAAKKRVLETSRIFGIRALTYYRNSLEDAGANNEELTYDFQGISRDGRFYISARIPIRHPSLPNSPSDPRAELNDRDPGSFLRDEKRVNDLDSGRLIPSLEDLDRTVGSVAVPIKP